LREGAHRTHRPRAYNRASMAADGARTWILTGSPDNHAATAAHGYAQGRLRTVSDANATLLVERMRAAAGVTLSS
jgi:hypothetical protein